MANKDIRLANVTEIARMFELSVNTVRGRLKAAKVKPLVKVANSPYYRLSQVGEALFARAEKQEK